MFTGLATPPLATLMPLLPDEGLRPEMTEMVYRMAKTYEEVLIHHRRPAGRLFRDDELATYAFGWHRARSLRTAHSAMVIEKRRMGGDFDLDRLTGRATAWVVLTESTSLLGRWHPNPPSASAAALIGSALRSASWLWLEDDDRAMSVLRSVLEQVARLRTWRLKPAKAERLESAPDKTRPRDWLEAAGWKRLRALNNALGEFAHGRDTSTWHNARELLSGFQLDADPDLAIFTARGASLQFVSELVADELLASLEGISPTISDGLSALFSDLGLRADQRGRTVDEMFDHIWSQRIADAGHASDATAGGDFKPRIGPGPPSSGSAAPNPFTKGSQVQHGVQRLSEAAVSHLS